MSGRSLFSLLATWFPVVVSQYLDHRQLGCAPSQNRTCAANASGSPRPHSRSPMLRSANRSGYHRRSGSVSGRCHFQNAMTARPPSLHQNYPASKVLCSLPTSPSPFASLASPACRAYSSTRTRATGISLVALLTQCVTRMGQPPRGSDRCLPITQRSMLLSAWPNA